MVKKIAIIFIAGVSVLICYFAFVPKVLVGDQFFGKYEIIYNPHIAAFFYKQALRFDTETDSPPPYAYYQLSRTYFIQGDLERALHYAYKELEHHPSHTHTYYIIGLTLGYMDRVAEAIDAFGKFLVYKPESWAARNDKAWLHFRIGDIDGALDTIIPATQDFPENPWVMNTFGVLLMNKGLYTEAILALKQAESSASIMNEEEWGTAYPGNSPEIYGSGLAAMRGSITENLARAQRRAIEVEDDDN